jgi:hypothetical protein
MARRLFTVAILLAVGLSLEPVGGVAVWRFGKMVDDSCCAGRRHVEAPVDARVAEQSCCSLRPVVGGGQVAKVTASVAFERTSSAALIPSAIAPPVPATAFAPKRSRPEGVGPPVRLLTQVFLI